MNSNFHYPIDLNEDQDHQPFFCALGSSLHHQASSSSSSSSSLSYLPFLINSHQQEHVVGFNTSSTFHGDHDPLSQPLEAKMLMPNGGSSCDHMVPKKETRLKLTIRKKEAERTDLLPLQNQNQNQTKPNQTTNTVKWMSSKMRMMKKMMITNNNKQPMNQNPQQDHDDDDHDHDDHDGDDDDHTTKKTSPDHHHHSTVVVYDNGYGNNNGVIRVCSDCNTTKTPLWRSGPRGPKSLCNACGIRQRKARRAAMAAAAGSGESPAEQPPQKTTTAKKKAQNKNKRSSDHFTPPQKAKKCKIMSEADSDQNQSKSSPSSSSSSSSKFGFDDLTIILSKSSAFQRVFPQDEREAAILLMALSYGMVHS